MPKKTILPFALLALVACLLTYNFGSAPVALAKGRASAQETSESAVALTLPTAPATWTLTIGSGASLPASVSQPAGGTGVKHVATCISFSVVNLPPATTASEQNVFLRNGPSKTGPWLFVFDTELLPNETFGQSVCGLNIVGSANTAMTLEFGNVTNTTEQTVTLVGYDAQ